MTSADPSIAFPGHASFSTAARRAPVAPPDRLISQPTVIAAVLLCDALSTIGAGLASHAARGPGASHDDPVFLLLATTGVALGVLALLGARWAYTIRKLTSATRQTIKVALALLLSLAGFVVCAALTDTYAPAQRAWLFEWFLTALGLCVTTRLYRRGDAGALDARRPFGAAGGDRRRRRRHDRIDPPSRPHGGWRHQILGLFDDRDGARSPAQVGAYCKLGRFEDSSNSAARSGSICSSSPCRPPPRSASCCF